MALEEELQRIYSALERELGEIDPTQFHSHSQSPFSEPEWLRQKLKSLTKNQDPDIQQRLLEEIVEFGPLNLLLEDEDVSEILINDQKGIWYEKSGQLYKHPQKFLGSFSFNYFIQKLCHKTQQQFNLQRPFLDGRFDRFRVHLVSPPLSQGILISLRAFRKSTWKLEDLEHLGWADRKHIEFIKECYLEKKNLLVVGATGSGKTTLLNSLLKLSRENDRIVCIEDTDEVALPNHLSVKLISRESQEYLTRIDLGQLVRQSLRMRPDRLVLGEVRGAEAKDLMLALSSGHKGSLSTLHGENAHQALMRLEMLVQMGAPQWSLETVRRLLLQSLDYVLVVQRKGHNRTLKSIDRLHSLEPFGITLEKVIL